MSRSTVRAWKYLIPSSGNATPVPGIALEDWEVLFNAVRSRLEAIARALPTAVSPLQGDDADAGWRADVLECVAALDQLQHALTPWRSAGQTGGEATNGSSTALEP